MNAKRRPHPADASNASQQRIRPAAGTLLTLGCVRPPFRPVATAAGAGYFAVSWFTQAGMFWAAVHDFEPADQLRLIAGCRQADRPEVVGAWHDRSAD